MLEGEIYPDADQFLISMISFCLNFAAIVLTADDCL